MKKCLIKYSILFIGLLMMSCDSGVDWTPYYTSDKTTPYGTYVLRKELDNIFENSEITDVKEVIADLDKYGFDYDFRYIFIYDRMLQREDALDRLARIASYGGSVFISTYETSNAFNEILEIETESYYTNNLTTQSLSLENNSNNEKYTLKDYRRSAIISNYNPYTTEVLGSIKIDDEIYPNFIRIRYGNGYIYYHSSPIIFTNYYMLENDYYNYVTEVFSYIEDGNILWANHQFYNINYEEKSEGDFFSALSFIQRHNSLMTALYLLILMGLMYLIFNSKRRQRILPIIFPYRNHTLDFAKTLAELYRHHPDHQAMAQYRINYFLEQIRTKYNITSKDIENDFAETLSAKSAVDLSTCRELTSIIQKIKHKNNITKDDFFQLNHSIEKFNHQSKIYNYGKS